MTYLALAIVLETIGTTGLKLSDGFSRPWPSVVAVGAYLVSLGLLSLALKAVQIGPAYAIWSAVGTALIATIGIIWFREPLTALKLGSLLLIIVGVVALNLSGAER
ncbi:MAG: multidrug efflux SMR transporter [Chloroflexi bacterium]|nr:multidrug efflux SMR transporter [Chloroflexota bacterium]